MFPNIFEEYKKYSANFYFTLKNLSLNAFNNTEIELNDIANAAIIGSNFGPLKNAYKTPAATGIPMIL